MFVFTAVPLGIIVVDSDSNLEQIRAHIDRLLEVYILQDSNANGSASSLSPTWCFLDCKYIKTILKNVKLCIVLNILEGEDAHAHNQDRFLLPLYPKITV